MDNVTPKVKIHTKKYVDLKIIPLFTCSGLCHQCKDKKCLFI
jgi:hypothetical protein